MANKVSIIGGASALPEESVGHLPLEIIYQSGVVDPTAHFLVYENNPKALSVLVAIGRAYFKKTSMTYNGYSTAINTIAITSNSSGNPRKDAIVAYVDLGASKGTDATGVLKIIAVAGTPATSPSAPDDTAVQSAVGAGNPFLRLANVNVINGASQIANTDITDTRVPAYVKILAGILATRLYTAYVNTSMMDKIVLTDSSVINIDCSLGQYFEVTIAGNRTINFTNYSVGQTIYLDVKQDATGGRSLTFGADVHFPYDTAFTLTSTANKVDSLIFKCYTANKLRAYMGGQGYTY